MAVNHPISRAIGEVAQSLQRIAAEPKRLFGELVCQRRRERDPVPAASKALPFVWPELPVEQVRKLDANLPLPVAQQRLQETHDALEEAYEQALRGYEKTAKESPQHPSDSLTC